MQIKKPRTQIKKLMTQINKQITLKPSRHLIMQFVALLIKTNEKVALTSLQLIPFMTEFNNISEP